MLNCTATCRSRDKKPGDNTLEIASAFKPISTHTEIEDIFNISVKECDAIREMKSAFADTLGDSFSTLAQVADAMNGEFSRRFRQQCRLKKRVNSAELPPGQRRTKPEI